MEILAVSETPSSPSWILPRPTLEEHGDHENDTTDLIVGSSKEGYRQDGS
jgi:hypothetical protein